MFATVPINKIVDLRDKKAFCYSKQPGFSWFLLFPIQNVLINLFLKASNYVGNIQINAA